MVKYELISCDIKPMSAIITVLTEGTFFIFFIQGWKIAGISIQLKTE